jgi:hypothetical protein
MERNEVRYLIVGGYAVMRLTEPRFTKDLDIWIETSIENAEKMFKSLQEFGAPLKGLSPSDFVSGDYFYQMGRPPLRVDIMMSIPGVKFQSAWQRREEVMIDNLAVPFLALEDVIRSKKASGRPQDLIDLSNLEKIKDNKG